MSLARNELKSLVNDFRNQVKISKQNPNKSKAKSAEWIAGQMKRVKSRKVGKPAVGRLYMFGYDAKNKDTLPYWDKFPLIICIGVTPTHLLGLNMHYIPPKAREIFLESLLKFASTKVISNKTKLKINWSKIKAFPGAHHMIKMYLASHVKVGFQEVAPKDWHNVIHLQTQQFHLG